MTFPSRVMIMQKEDTGLNYPKLSYSFEYASFTEAEHLKFLNIRTRPPNYSYSLSLGNTSDSNSGLISVSIYFPQEVIAVAAYLGNRTVEYKRVKEIHFQMPELKKDFGGTYTIAIAADDLPDLAKIELKITSPIGDFQRVPKGLYDKFFRPADK